MMNNSIFHGRLTADARVSTHNEKKVVNFTVAVPRDYKSDEGRKSDFIPCFKWSPNDFVIDRLKTGQEVIVSGRMEYRQYEKDDVKRSVLELNIENIDLILPKKQDSTSIEEVSPGDDEDQPF